MRAAILTPVPEFREDWRWAYDVEAEALERGGIAVEPRPWSDPGNLNALDAVLPLVVWGYHQRFADWLGLLDELEARAVRTINPVPLLRWNSDKAYLAELEASGVPTVPTLACGALDEAILRQAADRFATTDLVIKPRISAAADGTHRIRAGDPLPADSYGRAMLVQPFMPAIAATGEYSLMLFGGHFSHAIVKRPKAGDFRVQPHLGGSDRPCDPPSGGIELAQAALAAAPATATYARVDMIERGEGALRIMELELIEPALFLHHAPDRGAAFASAVRRAIEQPLA